MLSKSPGTLENHVQGTVLRRRRHLWKLQHLVHSSDRAHILSKRSLRGHTTRGNEPHSEKADDVVFNGKRSDPRERTEFLERLPLRGDGLESVGGPCMALHKPHVLGKSIQENCKQNAKNYTFQVQHGAASG